MFVKAQTNHSSFQKIIFALFFSVILIFPNPASALNIGTGEGGLLKGAADTAGYDKNTKETAFASTLGLVIRIALSFSGVIFLILMVYAGFLWMTARGEEAQVDKAQKLIRSAVIGLIITVGAYSITNFIVPKKVEKTVGSSTADLLE